MDLALAGSLVTGAAVESGVDGTDLVGMVLVLASGGAVLGSNVVVEVVAVVVAVVVVVVGGEVIGVVGGTGAEVAVIVSPRYPHTIIRTLKIKC